ncbi:MAG TPA: SWIM zinc finger family protein [Candidatus Lokiarchaeia archaeon]|nr:SWIM zinc finger family protein [Candidatus Lokiarchaeia archaeon]
MSKKTDLLQSFPITNAMIRAMADPQSYNRDRNYQLGGAVSHGVRTATGLKARVEGNYQPYYKVTITLTDSDDLVGNCSCPVGFGCKHCVAVCLEWLANPTHFSSEGSGKGNGARTKNVQEQSLGGESAKPTGTEVSKIIDSLPAEELKKYFLALWTCVAPRTHGDLIPNNLPWLTWLPTLDSIDYGSGEPPEKTTVGYAVDYSNEAILMDDPHPSFLQPTRKAPLIGRWFSPPELINFFPDAATKKELLSTWVDSYGDLGTWVRDAFTERGIIPPNAETMLEFYTEIYGDEWEREHEESGRSDIGWHRYDDDYDEFDSDNVELDDLYPLANRFVKRVTPLLRELAEYYCVLKQYGLNAEAQRFMTIALEWFVPDQSKILANHETRESGKTGKLDFGDKDDCEEEEDEAEDEVEDEDDLDDDDEEKEIDEGSLPDLETIRVEFRGILESEDLRNSTPQEKVDYGLKLLARNLNPGNAELIRRTVGQSDDPRQMGEYTIRKLKQMFEEKPQTILWTLIEQITDEYLPDGVSTLLQLAVQHLRQYPDPRALFHSITSHLGSQSPPFVRNIQDAIFNQLVTPVKKGKNRGETHIFSDLYVQAVN